MERRIPIIIGIAVYLGIGYIVYLVGYLPSPSPLESSITFFYVTFCWPLVVVRSLF